MYLNLIFVVLLVVIFLIRLYKQHTRTYYDDTNYATLALLLTLFIVINSLTWLCFYTTTKSEIVKYKTIQEMYERSDDQTDQRNAAFNIAVSEANVWLADKQYWNSIWITDSYIPDEIKQLKLIGKD